MPTYKSTQGQLKIYHGGKFMEKLSDKQRIFVQEYIKDFAPSRAAREAGYKQPAVRGNVLLRDPRVQAAIAELVKGYMKESRLSQESVLDQLYRFLFYDIRQFIGDDGFLCCSLQDLPDDMAQCIESWEVYNEYEEGQLVGQSPSATTGPRYYWY